MELSISNSDTINIQNILYCKAEGSYTFVILKNNKKLLLTKGISSLQSELSNYIFFRCHKSYLINLTYVNEVLIGNSCKVILDGTAIVDVAYRRKHKLIERLNKDSLLINL